MELMGAFRKFDLTKNPLAAIFIFSGEWEIFLHSKRDPGWVFEDAILGKGKVFFKKESGKLVFYVDPFTVEVFKTGVCYGALLRQDPFKILLRVAESGDELNLSSCSLTLGSQIRIEAMRLTFGGNDGS
jgi:hypothetical protein